MRSPLEVLKLYPEHDYTLHSAFESRAEHDPGRPFILFEGRTQSWGTFSDLAARTAQVLLDQGVKPGDRVAVMARNRDGIVQMLFAAARIGAIMVPVNPEFGVNEVRYVLNHADVCGVVASGDALAVTREAAEGMAAVPWFLCFDGGTDIPSLADLAAAAAPAAPAPDVTADTTCLIIYTSGTTGFPKGAMHSQRTFLLTGEATVQRVHLQETDRVLIILPLFHVNALFYSLSSVIAAGASVAILPRFSASTFWQSVVETGATQVNILDVVGTILVSRPRSEFRPEHKLRVVYGVRQKVAGPFLTEFGIRNQIAGFGMTEIPGLLASQYPGQARPGSMGLVGHHPDPAREVAVCRVVDDEGHDVAPNEVGELVVRTPMIMQGYFRDPEQTAAAFRDGWFLTGDLVRRDEDGHFFYVTRKKDIIRRRGENIAGAELDRVIGEHPAVFEVAAVAVPSELGEDEILAAIALKPGMTATAEDIAEWCRARLAPMKVPRFVLFMDELPHTPTHKVAKNVLRQDKDLRTRAVDLQPPARA